MRKATHRAAIAVAVAGIFVAAWSTDSRDTRPVVQVARTPVQLVGIESAHAAETGSFAADLERLYADVTAAEVAAYLDAVEAERVERERADALRTSRSVKPAPAAVDRPVVSDGDIWWRLALCECGGNPACNTGNGFYGTFQFMLSTWRAVGGEGYPHEHPYEEQRYRAQILQARAGWGQWPACARSLGLL